MSIRTLLCASFAVLLFASTAAAQGGQVEFEQGLAARDVGDYAQALKLFAEASDKGHAGGLLELGVAYDLGRGVARDDGRAMTYYRQAAAKGNPIATHNVGVFLRAGRGAPKDAAQAADHFRRAAEAGHVPAMYAYARANLIGEGVSADTAAFRTWVTKGAEAGDADAMSSLAYHLDLGKVFPRDPARSVDWAMRAVDAGSAVAAINLGTRYWNGEAGAPGNFWNSKAYYQAASDMGDERGTAELPRFATQRMPQGGQAEYDRALRADNIENDRVKAFGLYAAAFAAGHKVAGSFVVEAYQQGRGVTKDLVAARRAARVCAAMENSSCQTILGQLLSNGVGGGTNKPEARAQFERAALDKNTLAMFFLAQMYDAGDGIPRNDALATHWFRTAYTGGSAKAEAVLKSRGLIEMDPRASTYIAYIHANGPSRRDAPSFAYEVAVYCKLGGPRCHEYTVAAHKFAQERNSAAESANMQRVWNVYAAPSGKTSDAEWRARSDCMRKKTESIQKQTYGQQDWSFSGSC